MRTRSRLMFGGFAAGLALAAAWRPVGDAMADDAPQVEATVSKLVSLTVYPSAMSLKTNRDTERIAVIASYEDGVTRDVTTEATIKIEPEGLAKLDEKFIMAPVADGDAKLTASFGGLGAEMPIKVADAAAPRAMSFRLDVEPALMRAGCNSGACHGASKGKNGFRMSLFGFDPKMDHQYLTREAKARRLTTADPDDSLLLQKATTGVAHEGGERFKPGDELYSMIEKWIKEGANFDPDDVAKLKSVEILPKQMVLLGSKGDRHGDAHRIIVRAFYSDGTDRDVTNLAVIASLNDSSAVVADGVVTGKERGEASVIARFGTYAVVTQAIVIPPGEPYEFPAEIKPSNYIDELSFDKLKKVRLIPSGVADDSVFVRRVYVDIVGILPTREETEKFLADASPDKRAKLVDELLQRPEFPELWAMKWAEMLQIESATQRISFKAMYRYNTWLRDQIVAGVPMDKMVKSLLTAKGGNFDNPASNFYMLQTDPKLVGENVAQVFLGIRVQCAQCHNHPFERWTMDDYYSFAAYFAQIGRKPAEDPRETVVFNSGGGEVGHINGGRPMPPKNLGQDDPANVAGKDRREVLAEWLTSPENPWFSKVFANRVWAHFMGRGIVDPPDDVRVSNPPSNPELFERLGKEFIASGYDIRKLVRDICNSRTYQTSTSTTPNNESDLSNFSHRIPRRLPAEQLLDSIVEVTESPEKFRGLPIGARAAQVADGNPGNYFLSIFGRPTRQSACTCDRRNEPTLSQALHLINGDTVQSRIKAGKRLERMVKDEKPIPEVVQDLYLAAYSRPATAEEVDRAEKYVADAGDKRAGLEDVYWSVLNSKEFVFHH